MKYEIPLNYQERSTTTTRTETSWKVRAHSTLPRLLLYPEEHLKASDSMIPHVSSLLRRSSRALSCRHYSSSAFRRAASDNNIDLRRILNQLSEGKLTPAESEALIRRGGGRFFDGASASSPEKILQSFANIDHTRSSRTGFPEAVFGAGKTPEQIAMILDDMARHFNERVSKKDDDDGAIDSAQRAMLATR